MTDKRIKLAVEKRRKGDIMSTVSVYTGAIWNSCEVTLVEEHVPATPEAVAEAANVSIGAAKKALEQFGENIFAGWVDPASWDIVSEDDIPEDAVEIDTNREGDPVYETEDGVWEPFYICVIKEEE